MRVVSGIQPTGDLHLGNYFGAIRQYLELQDEHECFFFVVDYHALTTMRDADLLRRYRHEAVCAYLALGLDPSQASIFVQSDVPAVTELAWILSTITPMGLLQRAHAYKDKVSRGVATDHGLFAYPVLMAADILAYQSNLVPVGRDQKQHVEVTRDIAIKFNGLYGEVFTIPEPEIRDAVAVVPGIDGQKMSKSYDNHIEMFGDLKQSKARIMRIVTDSTPLEEPKDPDKCNVFAMYRLFASDEECAEMADRYRKGGYGYGSAKKELFEVFQRCFEPLRRKREKLEADPEHVDAVLRDGAERARIEARKTLNAARQAAGVA